MTERKIKIITVIVSIALFICFAAFIAAKVLSVTKSSTGRSNQAAVTRTVKVKANGMKILDDELLSEDYRIFYEKDQEARGLFQTILYAVMFLIIAIVIITIVSKIGIAISRHEGIPILTIGMTLFFGIACVATILFFQSGVRTKLKKDESEFKTAEISILYKQTKDSYDSDGNLTTQYFIYFSDGSGSWDGKKVTKSMYDSVTEGHNYYLATTKNNVWFALYDTQEYEQQNNSRNTQ